MNIKNIAIDFLQMVVAGKINEAYQKYIASDFRHHNAYYRGDAASLKQGMIESQVQDPHKSLEIQQTICEGDLVMVHSWLRKHPGDNGATVVHIFKIQNLKIIEMWDIGMPIPESSPNENGIF